MAKLVRPPIERDIDDASLTALEADALLEIGYLAMIADGPPSDTEIEAFSQIATRLCEGRDERDIDVGEILERFSDLLVRSGIEARLAGSAARLERPAVRRRAYRIASALSLCDLASNDRERAFDAQLVVALGLTDAEADALAMDAYATIPVAADS